MIVHLGTSELIDLPDIIGTHFRFDFDGIETIYGGTKINIKGLTVKEALLAAHKEFALMLNDVHKERERLLSNVQHS